MDETEGEETGLEGEDTTKPQSCAGCSRPIRGRYVYKVLEKTWHAGCVCCHDCRLPLSEKCYCRDELLFCKDHFYRRYGIKCTACGEGIPPTTLVRRAIDNVYHMHCFKCNTCERQLETGDEFFLMEDGKVVCKEDQEKAKDPDDAEFTVKRPRTSISTEQKDALKVVYAKNTRPTRTVREDLARATGLPARVVQVWFQNKRAKERRCQKETFELTKARQGSSKLKREGKSKTKSRTVSKRPRTTETQSSVSETEQHQGGSLIDSEDVEVSTKQCQELLSTLPELVEQVLPEIALDIQPEYSVYSQEVAVSPRLNWYTESSTKSHGEEGKQGNMSETTSLTSVGGVTDSILCSRLSQPVGSDTSVTRSDCLVGQATSQAAPLLSFRTLERRPAHTSLPATCAGSSSTAAGVYSIAAAPISTTSSQYH